MTYQAPMLPEVDYEEINDDSFFTLVDLEYDTMQSCSDFLEELKSVLLDEQLIQPPQIIIAYLCAYLGTATTIHMVKKADTLTPLISALIQHQAQASLKYFNQHPINHTTASTDEKNINFEYLRQNTPGSIVVQTIRLGREIIDMIDELEHQQRGKNKKQTTPFCSNETLTKIMLLMASQRCPQWRNELDGLSRPLCSESTGNSNWLAYGLLLTS
jgi:hypothetical protein